MCLCIRSRLQLLISSTRTEEQADSHYELFTRPTKPTNLLGCQPDLPPSWSPSSPTLRFFLSWPLQLLLLESGLSDACPDSGGCFCRDAYMPCSWPLELMYHRTGLSDAGLVQVRVLHENIARPRQDFPSYHYDIRRYWWDVHLCCLVAGLTDHSNHAGSDVLLGCGYALSCDLHCHTVLVLSWPLQMLRNQAGV